MMSPQTRGKRLKQIMISPQTRGKRLKQIMMSPQTMGKRLKQIMMSQQTSGRRLSSGVWKPAGSAPSYLSQLLHLYSPSRSLRSSSDTRMLKLQRFSRKTHGFRTFSHFGPHIWNYLPQDIRHSATLSLSLKANWRHFSSQNISVKPHFLHSYQSV